MGTVESDEPLKIAAKAAYNQHEMTNCVENIPPPI